jgi:hypothetical protein
MKYTIYILIGICFILSGCGDFLGCGTTQVIFIPSPQKNVGASIYNIDCGATTASAVHVAIHSKCFFWKKEDVFIFEGDAKNVIIRWITPKDLEVRFHEGRVFKKEVVIMGINIHYTNR